MIVPTVDNPNADSTLTTNTPDPAAVVSGTGEPGSTVEVTIGDQTQTTVIGDDGTWDVVFEDDTLPSDGDYSSEVTVTAPDGTEYELDGPDFLIDLTPPPVAITEGAESTGDVENAEEYKDGITIGGTGEAGASIVVEVAGRDAIDDGWGTDGSWSVTFPTTDLPGGTYTEEITVTATDVNGNTTTITDTLVVDTEITLTQTVSPGGADGVVSSSEVSALATIGGRGGCGVDRHRDAGRWHGDPGHGHRLELEREYPHRRHERRGRGQLHRLGHRSERQRDRDQRLGAI